MQNFSNMLVIDGGTVKTEQEGIVKGLGIVFGSEQEPDAYRDFFTPETQVRKSTSFTVPLYYNHGLGAIDTEIGEATLTKTDEGWEAEAVIDVNDPLGAKVYKAVKKKPHGFSTGALQHLVKREPKANDTNLLTQWVVGELSLTERPAERKAIVQSIKSIDGEIVVEDWVDYAPVVSVKDSEGNEIWNLESEISFSEFIKNAEQPVKSFEVKYTSGTVQYNLYTYDEDTGKGAEIYVTEWGSPEELLNHVAEVINKAKFQLKSTPEEVDLEDKIQNMVTKAVKDLGGCGCGGGKDDTAKGSPMSMEDCANMECEPGDEDCNTKKKKCKEQMKTELADLKAKLSEREDALAQARSEIETLQILAGAKETINKVKENYEK